MPLTIDKVDAKFHDLKPPKYGAVTMLKKYISKNGVTVNSRIRTWYQSVESSPLHHDGIFTYLL